MQIHIDIFIQICVAMSVNKCQADLLAKGRAAPAAPAAADATVNRLRVEINTENAKQLHKNDLHRILNCTEQLSCFRRGTG